MNRLLKKSILTVPISLAMQCFTSLYCHAEGDFGIQYVNDNTLKVYHSNDGWTGLWNYVCLNSQCLPGEKTDQQYERIFNNVSLGQNYNIEFKVQDSAIGQYIVSDQVVFTEPSSPSTPAPTINPTPTATVVPTVTPAPTIIPTPTTAPDPARPTVTPAPNNSPTPSPTPAPVEFGIETVDNNTMKIFHVDKGWTAGFAYMCLGTDCVPPSLNNGRYERNVGATPGQTYNIEFKVQDNTVGEYIAQDTVTFNGGSGSGGGGSSSSGGNTGSGGGGTVGTPVPTPPPVTGGSNQNSVVNCSGGTCTTVFAERLTLRHQGDVLNNQYINNYFSGGLYEIELIDKSNVLEVHVYAPMEMSMVNFTYNHIYNGGFADPPQYTSGGMMHKHSPSGPADDALGNMANHFYFTINDWGNYTSDDIFTLEFTPRVPDGSGNAPQYYSDIIEYFPRKGGITTGTTYGGNTDKKYSAGPVTNYKQGSPDKYMAQAFLTISLSQMDDFLSGRRIFHADFVDGENHSGGPLFTKRACIDCHINDGRGGAPGTGDAEGYIIKVRNDDDTGPHPIYGSTLDPFSVSGVPFEGNVDSSGNLVDNNEPIAHYGVRIAPPLIGIGLLEAVPDSTIEGFAARNGGKVSRVNSSVKGSNAIGRYGWKASVASIEEQVGSAYRNDMGVTNYLFPNHDITPSQVEALARADDGAEISEGEIELVSEYIRALAVPMRRHPEAQASEQFNTNIRGVDAQKITDNDVTNGEAAFINAGCADCHIPEMQTGNDHKFPQYRNITIRPYTDMLLHDMGPELAGTSEEHASATEWRTPPLWGIRLTEQTIGEGKAGYMHDGRAKSLDEAIRLHGGEAAASRDAYLNGNQSAILLFLRTL